MPQPPIEHELRVPFDGTVRVADLPTRVASSTKEDKRDLEARVARIARRQDTLHASGGRALLCVFQGIDGSGKDSTIEKVFSGVNPAGVRVASFKQPTSLELGHDFLWRHVHALPARGEIGVWNRSWYEEVLVVRVHPEYLRAARLDGPDRDPEIWEHRFQSIREHERHLSRNGTVILKFFLNLSKDEQRSRFLARLDDPEKRWKFNPGDLGERARWDDYQRAWQDALRETSRPWAPWFAVPADDKDHMRAVVAGIIADTLDAMDLRYPELAPEVAADPGEWRRKVERA
ncbi:MAG TPA: polyphosphate kinase 2 family protein [Myxococcota bacterium]|nr:polyphosphate kinase 2 family protein [Myxococcota bacterium]